VQSDCPAREKYQYGGDMFCNTEAFIYNYDMARFYRKVIQDHVNAQRPLGGITETAPYIGIADAGPGDDSGPISFQIGFAYAIKKLHEFYGDERVITDYYEPLRKQVKFLRDNAKNNLFYNDLGDHESLEPKSIALVASSFYYFHIKLIEEFAGILGKTEDVKMYAVYAREVEKSIVEKFFDRSTGKFESGTQSDQLFGLWNKYVTGKDKDAAMSVFIQEVNKHNGHLSTGIFGTKMMFDVLRENEDNELMYKIVNQREFPGWGYMIENGATTLWETWKYSDDLYSHNHPMFGSVGEWFYRSLLGINAASPGFKKIIIKPQPAGDLRFAKGSYHSVQGPIESNWQIVGNKFILKVQIPPNTSSQIWVPSTQLNSITESGKPIEKVPEIKFLRIENGYSVFETGSGKYCFEAALK
jgi:alpha-L-rhamnosidase